MTRSTAPAGEAALSIVFPCGGRSRRHVPGVIKNISGSESLRGLAISKIYKNILTV